MKLLVDNNLPPRLARGLGAFFDEEHIVIHIKEKFGRGNLSDEDWIRLLGREGHWCVLTADRNIAKKRPSRQLFLACGLIGFFPSPSVAKWPMERLAARLLTLWPSLVNLSESVSSGCYEISATGDRLRGF
ncbi:hypothetical protein ACQEPB_03565 [Novosphingobium fluoreni]|uniref:PIN-like domain-containing protein n=1 Tax=Novosphingobium fluoreni TaxID=1391222 RepID=UPI003DA0BB06